MYVYTSFSSASCPTIYSNNPLLGCYIILRESNLISHNYAKERCSDDGGALLLLNSKEETYEVVKLMCNFYFLNYLVYWYGLKDNSCKLS